MKLSSLSLSLFFLCFKARLREFCSRFNIEFRQMVDEHTTHLITDEEEGETLVCPLSKKVIQAVARHMYIVTYRWIDTCLKSNEIVYEKPFEIQGDLTLSSDHHGLSSLSLVLIRIISFRYATKSNEYLSIEFTSNISYGKLFDYDQM